MIKMKIVMTLIIYRNYVNSKKKHQNTKQPKQSPHMSTVTQMFHKHNL